MNIQLIFLLLTKLIGHNSGLMPLSKHQKTASFLFTLLSFFPLISFTQGTVELDKKSLLNHIQILAADSLEGRKIATPGHKKARDYIKNELADYASLEEQVFPIYQSKKEGVNIIFTIEGSEKKDKKIVITAHYDHLGIEKRSYIRSVQPDTIYNGADDNASGVSLLIEMVKYFHKNQPQHSIYFVFTDAEESGLVGASYFVKNFKGVKDIVLNVNMDMISISPNNQLNICGLRYSEELSQFFKAQQPKNNLNITKGHDGKDGKENWTEMSDHYPFHRKKIPFLYFGVEDHQHYHQSTDNFENINPDFYLNSCNFILNSIVELDNRLQ